MEQYIPPLSIAELEEADEIERKLTIALRFNAEKKSVFLEYVKGYALEMFSLYERVFTKDATHKATPRELASARAGQRIAKCVIDSKLTNDKLTTLFIGEIEKTLADKIAYLASKEPIVLRSLTHSPNTDLLRITPNTPFSPAALGIPALKSTMRRSAVIPKLEEKGWSILDWANEANVAPHTATDYLAGKTEPYPSTRRKLAEALGLTIQQLPR